MREIWKAISGFEGLYEVSDLGNVKRLEIEGKTGTGNYGRKERILSKHTNNKGYELVDLFKDGKVFQSLVHRLVALAFLENPDNMPEVNHKDENKRNNSSDNLEWCTHKYNMNYGELKNKIGKANSIQIIQKDLNGNVIKMFNSAMEAQRETGIRNGNINECCKMKRKTAGGYLWEYAV